MSADSPVHVFMFCVCACGSVRACVFVREKDCMCFILPVISLAHYLFRAVIDNYFHATPLHSGCVLQLERLLSVPERSDL